MQLIVMRHGEAGFHPDDIRRSLTERGQRESDSVARQLQQAGWGPADIWCSPLVRARQTAERIAEVTGQSVIERDFLKPEENPGQVIELLQQYRGKLPLILVSHMPLVGLLVGALVERDGLAMPLTTSEAWCLEMEFPAAGCAEVVKQLLP